MRAGNMTVYLSSPGSAMHCVSLSGMPVLLSFACWTKSIGDYETSFGRVMLDSGAFSELNTGKKIDLAAYIDWARARLHWVDAAAGLDDISGDWRRSLANYEAFPEGFPTIHETDPDELLPDLIAMARERGGWIGVGMLPPRSGKEAWLRRTLKRIPSDLHVHGWALREYAYCARLDSLDSTNWFRDAWGVMNKLPWLTPAEAVEIVVKRYQREKRVVRDDEPSLFGDES